ncbi:MAG: DUF2911 domain-containing protein [Bacteroidetes bacterium]|nr:DUF2911 domain-containing protein [Bacteroidota bacterium]HET6246024.1 DUF2911 domain-containing protein [Bacteroidia bacterium]
MKKLFATFIISAGALLVQPVFAQLDLPQPSPKAMVKQTVGLTDVTIDYSSPAVNKRVIWGDLVPYSEMWRTGANMASKITFSKEVTIGGKAVAAGSYAFLTIPEKEEWTVIINSDSELRGTDGYSIDKDVVRLKVKPQVSPNRERLTFLISDFSNTGGNISLEWEKLKIDVPFTTATDEQALKNINNSLNASWRNYTNAANYMLTNKKDLDKALTWINQSIAISPDQWYSHWIKAQIHAEKKQSKEAFASAQKAKELGDKNPAGFFYKEAVEKALVDWKPAKK